MEKPRGEGRAGPRDSRTLATSTPLKYLPGVGPQRAELLEKLGLHEVGDLLDHLPRRYENRRRLRRISDAVAGEWQVLHGALTDVRERPLRGRRSIVQARLIETDDDIDASGGQLPLGGLPAGHIELVWFNQSYLMKWLRPGVRLYAYGQVKRHQGRLQMVSPEFEFDSSADDPDGDASPHVKRIVPVYPLTRGVHQRFLRGLVYRVLEQIPEAGKGPHDLFHPEGPTRMQAYRLLHFPGSWKDIERARARFIFEEYFIFATHLLFRRRQFRCAAGCRFQVTEELDRKIRSIFPFRFTEEQDRVVGEMVGDFGAEGAMYRLLQGDVGTGKTAVALYGMLVAVRNRAQAALMAPTEILAEQHHATITRYLARHPVRVGLLTGSIGSAARRSVLEDLASGRIHIVVGTHALVQSAVQFRRLGLAVIDEQHRFGVRERRRLRLKGDNPHLLVMTATPIPRSLCLTSYGDLDLSLLKERPRGRRAVSTILVESRRRAAAMDFIRKELRKGRQAYFVCPLIDESESLALPAARKAWERLSRQVFPEFRVGLVHGKLTAAEKDEQLSGFRSGDTHVLVATVVVEVGIDVPNATILFLEDASRFGLAQLHQLRGRVGRGAHQGYCLVGVDSASREVRARLEAFAATEDGFQIAEEDLRLRGPGDYLGVRQSGRPHFLMGNPLEDLAEFLRVKAMAESFWARRESSRYRREWAALLEEEESEVPGEEGFVGLD